MNTQVNRMPLAAPAWLYLQRAREAVNRAAAELPRTQFDPQARRQYALELAALMGEVELLLSTLQRQASDDPCVRRPQPLSHIRGRSAWTWRSRRAGTATTQITEIRRSSLTLMAAIFERTRTLLREGSGLRMGKS
jgi:hypothetical protein